MSEPRGTVARKPSRSASLKFVLLIGVLSFFADFTYEGSRSITGPFLAVLGASGTLVGIVAGLGELLGYGLRVISGRLSELTQKFWPITIFGYVVQMSAVPLLALAGSWQFAAVLIILWLLGLVTGTTIGGFIHLLLVIAVIMILIRLIRGEPIL